MSLVAEKFPLLKQASVPQTAVLRSLLYFDLFNHPLTAEEIYTLCQNPALTRDETDFALDELLADGIIYSAEGYYFFPGKHDTVSRRRNGEAHAEASLLTAQKYSARIARFPFIRSISLSGSISKKYMDSKSDIDYFIVTTPGRMWLARTLLVFYKKIFLFNSHKHFCINYFLTEDTLEVPDKNMFTATEVSYLMPTYNYALYKTFMKTNRWSKKFLPNFPQRGSELIVGEKNSWSKSLLEKILSGAIGNSLDTFFFRLTLRFWKKKFSHFDASTFDFRLRSRKNVSKHHPLGYQEVILKRYADRMAAFTRANNILLHAEDSVHA